MNRFEQWLVHHIVRKEVRQGFDHPQRITNLYKIIRVAAESEFTEDNIPTLNHSLTEWFEKSLR